MNHDTCTPQTIRPHADCPALRAAEDEALRLLGGHARDRMARIAILFDLKVRRAAYRIAGVVNRIGCLRS